MKIWRNDQVENVDEYEFNNWLATTIDHTAKDFGLLSEVIECKAPKIQREFWTKRNSNRTHFVLKEVKPVEDNLGGSYLLSYEVLFPDNTRTETHSVFYCRHCIDSIRESISEIRNWYDTRK